MKQDEIIQIRIKYQANIPDLHNGAYRKVWQRAMDGSLAAAVKAKCLDCCVWDKAEIKDCQCPACPLYPKRPYVDHPKRAKKVAHVDSGDVAPPTQVGDLTMTAILCMICMTDPTITDAQKVDLVRTIKAIAIVESGGDPKAVGDGGRSVGLLQISKPVLIDVNVRYGTHYTPQDRTNVRKSVEICVLYLMLWEPNGCPETWCRLWNSGPQWRTKKHKSDPYWRKIQAVLR